MTGTELATCIRYGQSSIIIILNNHGYSTEREILEGHLRAIYGIHEWRYERICELMGEAEEHGSPVTTSLSRRFPRLLPARVNRMY